MVQQEDKKKQRKVHSTMGMIPRELEAERRSWRDVDARVSGQPVSMKLCLDDV